MKMTRKEALNKVAAVLTEALNEYEKLEKNFGEEEEEDKEEGAEAQPEMSDDSQAEDEQYPETEQDEQSEEEAPQAEEEGEEEDDQPMDDETLKSEHLKLSEEMSKRGLSKTEVIKKSETASLKKYETQISDLSKTVSELQASIKKIASAPAPRKGATGYNPLKKNTEETGTPLNKAEVVNKLLDLKKSGRALPAGLINRIEGERLSEQDVTIIKGLLA